MSNTPSKPVPWVPLRKDGKRSKTTNRFRYDSSDAESRSPLSNEFIKVLELKVGTDESVAGNEIAREGLVVSFELVPGQVLARVRGSDQDHFDVTLTLATLDAAQWERVITAMTAEAVYVARLRDGELPATTVDLFESLGLALIPESMDATCTCGNGAPCRHVAAAGYVMSQMLNDDACSILAVRGLALNDIVERLSLARVANERQSQSGTALPQTHDESSTAFWQCGPTMSEVMSAAPMSHPRHALLRRMGPSPMGGSFPIMGLLASVYDAVSKAACDLRDEASPDDDNQSSE